jgi:hypothetical protein
MAFNLKTWVNRISEYPNRRKLTHEDGSTELVTVARAEGQISAEGNAFSAEEMNDLENRIKGGFDEVNQSLTNLKNPAKGTKGILVDSGSPLTKDCLLIYTITTTDVLYSGGNLSINDIRVVEFTAQKANCPNKIVGAIRAFKGDKISYSANTAGGTMSVYAYKLV